MDIQDLRVLSNVIESGGITSASKRIHRTPASLTTRINKLEKELEVELFIRDKKSMIPTGKAIELYNYARQIIQLADEAKARVIDEEPKGLLRIGAMESTIISRLTPILSHMNFLYPKLEIAIKAANSGELYDDLLNNELDAVFVADINYSYDSNVYGEAAYEEKLLLVTPKSVRTVPEELPKIVAVMNQTCSYRKRLINWLGERRIKKHKIIDFNSNSAILCAVASGQGFGFVPCQLINYFPHRHLISTFELPESISKVTTTLLWKGSEKNPSIKALRQAIFSSPSLS